MPAPPQEFFERYVKRSFEEYRSAPLDEYVAQTAVQYANIMAERMWHYYKDREPARVYNAPNAGAYREELAARVCDDVALVRDVAEGFKHVQIARKSRRVTSSNQAGYEPTGWGQFKWGEAFWKGWIVVQLDDGTKRGLLTIVGNVVIMWERLIG